MADWLVEFTVEDGLEDQPDLRREWHLQGKRGWCVGRKGASSAFRPEFRTEAEAIDQPASLHEDTEAPKLCRLVKYRDSFRDGMHSHRARPDPLGLPVAADMVAPRLGV